MCVMCMYYVMCVSGQVMKAEQVLLLAIFIQLRKWGQLCDDISQLGTQKDPHTVTPSDPRSWCLLTSSSSKDKVPLEK